MNSSNDSNIIPEPSHAGEHEGSVRSHTPGPLKAEPECSNLLDGLWMVVIEDRPNVCTASYCTKADAHLYAAAPELLEALDELTLVVGLTAFKHEGQRAVLQKSFDRARAAIAKAVQP